jgi:hypothetical protein
MIINLRLPHTCRGKVRESTITEIGAEYVCSKCYKVFFKVWETPSQIISARIYLQVKESDKIMKKMGWL